VILDNFILHDNVATGLNRLTNGNLNTPGNPVGWTLTEGPSGLVNGMMVPADSAQFTFFANREIADTANLNPLPPPEFLDKFTGQQGLWLRPFVNTTQFDPDIPSVDAVLTQVVSATEGASYEFSAWAAWEVGYCDGLPGDTTADTFMKMEFLDGSMAVIGTEILHLAADGQVNDDLGGTEYDDWMQHFLNGVAPGGTTQVRVSLGATGMYDTGLGIPESAFFDEMSLIETLPGAGAGAASVAVPEPNSLMLLVVGLAFGTIGVRRRRSG